MTTVGQPITPTITTWQIDPAHTVVEFAVKHLMITTVKGRFTDVSGTVRLNEADPTKSSVEATIAAASIDTRQEQRDAHLRSADFLEVDRYPAITFRSTRIETRGAGALRVTGLLTIRGTTREVTLDVEHTERIKDLWGGERMGFSATTQIDRRDFGLTWNQTLETGGVLVGNEVRITIEGEVVKAAEA
jgi:polyisoprenoid-binding protein YceI